MNRLTATPTSLLFALLTSTLFVAPLRAQPSVDGQWTGVISWGTAGGVEAIHLAMLPNGKVMFWSFSASGMGLWDPVTQQFSAAALPGTSQNPFCAGHAWLSDGRLLIMGGNLGDHEGDNRANIYNPFTNTWANNVPNMPNVPAGAPYGSGRNGRWYPSATTLGNGDVLVMSGDMNGKPPKEGSPPREQPDENPLPQVYQAATNTWRNLTGAYNRLPIYPRVFLAPDGRAISTSNYAGATEYLDTSATGSWSPVTNLLNTFGQNNLWYYAPAVMYDTGKIILIGGDNDPVPTATAQVIDLNAPSPSWSYTAGNMAVPRQQHNATILADGTVLVMGGTTVGTQGESNFNDENGRTSIVELWDPDTGLFDQVAPASSAYRGYHATSVLLPDGRVIFAGGNHDASGTFVDNKNAEIYSPAYLFKGPRPTITFAPPTAVLGRSFFVATPDAADIADVTFVVPGVSTHSQDWTQRLDHLDFTVVEGGLAITLPSNPNVDPAGYHMLFLINNEGVPSVASWVRALLPIAGVPGDFNTDGTVDAADYVVWRNGVGSTYNAADYVDWQLHFGGPTGGGGSADDSPPDSAVPEPSVMILFAIRIILLLGALGGRHCRFVANLKIERPVTIAVARRYRRRELCR